MRYLLQDIFMEAVKKYPEKIAIQQESGKSYRYRELNHMANHISHILFQMKPSRISEAPFTGILAPVHAYSIAAVLGILKTGGAYVPLDEQSPVERLDKIIDNLKLDTVIIDAFFLEKFNPLLQNQYIKNILILSEKPVEIPASSKNILWLDVSASAHHAIEDPAILNQVSDDLAYILHSSGSTGIPKGIMLTHRNARTFVDWMQKTFQLNEQDVVMSRAPFKFDLSVFDIFNTLSTGATLICFDWCISRENSQKHKDYVSLMEHSQATFLYTTPSTFIALLNHGQLGKNTHALRTIMYAGEPFPLPQLRQLKKALPLVRIANIYGPTETNIITCYWIDDLEQHSKAIPLGWEVDDTEIIIVHPEEKRLCLPDEVGELWCRGGTVTLGYLGDEQKTKEHAIQSPFHPYPARFWRTGDYGFRDNNGCLHYRGRRDHLVKIKGYRVELGEIESAIASLDSLDEFCVIALNSENQHTQLACIYSTKSKKALTREEFVKHLNQHVPAYMIPASFHFLSELPKTSSGKIDRVLLANMYTKETCL